MLTVPCDDGDVSRPLTIERLTKLSVASGRLIAGDVGLGFDSAKPFVRTIPPGAYDVFVSIWGREGRGKGPSDSMGDSPRAAYLALVISAGQPAKYEFAATGSQPPDWEPSDVMEGFGVDVGPVGLMDAERLPGLDKTINGLDLMELEEQAFAKRPELAGVAGCLEIPARPPYVVPCSESGWGDGSYFSYWGLNARNEPMVLIVDFDLDRKWPAY